MFFVIGFFSLLLFDLGFLFGCFFGGRKNDEKADAKTEQKEFKKYKPSRKDQNLIDDLNFLNSFTGEERK